jgi:hypothetical protein
MPDSANETTGWRPIATAPKSEMFIWAYWKRETSSWSVGLAYNNVSGTFSDAYGLPAINQKATHWHPMPEPPHA